MSTLRGQRVWITGASSGIGAALAEELAGRGCRLALTARSAEALERLATELPDAIALTGDITDRDRMREIVRDLEDRWGGIDIAVLNAGIYRPVTPQTFTAEIVREHVEINIMGTANCMEAVFPAMLARRGGRLAVMASVTGYAALPLAAAYGGTKAFLISMCESLQADLTESGVELTVISPGFVHTGATAQNDFTMPFVISPQKAARIIAEGLERGDPEIAFPRRMAFVMKLLGALPGRMRRGYVRAHLPQATRRRRLGLDRHSAPERHVIRDVRGGVLRLG